MTRDPDYWRRRFERAEAGRLAALDQLRDMSLKLIDIATDEQQQQIDALEQLVLNRAALSSITVDGRKLRFTFVRRGAVYQITSYAGMDTTVEKWRKDLLE